MANPQQVEPSVLSALDAKQTDMQPNAHTTALFGSTRRPEGSQGVWTVGWMVSTDTERRLDPSTLFRTGRTRSERAATGVRSVQKKRYLRRP
jgi:hypothetical protein